METRARRVTAQPNRAKRETKTSFFIKEPMDMTFFILVLVILAIGLVMMFSASFATAYFEEGDSYYYIKRQLTFALLGCTVMVCTSKINYKYLKMVSWLFYGGSVVLLILVLLVGTGDGVEKALAQPRVHDHSAVRAGKARRYHTAGLLLLPQLPVPEKARQGRFGPVYDYWACGGARTAGAAPFRRDPDFVRRALHDDRCGL